MQRYKSLQNQFTLNIILAQKLYRNFISYKFILKYFILNKCHFFNKNAELKINPKKLAQLKILTDICASIQSNCFYTDEGERQARRTFGNRPKRNTVPNPANLFGNIKTKGSLMQTVFVTYATDAMKSVSSMPLSSLANHVSVIACCCCCLCCCCC
ncbi:MAG: hypothetical protein RLZZ628_2453 [Bacteroidota bacterium]